MSLKGRITIIKALVLPQILFLFNLIYVPNETLDQINKEFFNFLWRNKPPKIKKETIIGQLEDGGLKMIDVYNMHVAAKCSWIRRLVSNENGSWKKLFYKMLSINRNMLNKKINLEYAKNCLSPFHRQVLESWIKVFCVKPETTTEILNEYILYNREIIIGKKIIALYQLPNKHSYDIKIVDILDSEGNILKRSQLNQKLETHLSEMFYNSVVSSIPQVWKKKLRPVQIPKEGQGTDEINIKVDSKWTPLSKTNSKLIYESLLKQIIKPPTSINTWIEIYPFLEKFNWTDTFILPYKVLREAHLQSFQYKILNRIINCNYNLHKWGIKESSQCIYCTSVDTVGHHLYECNACKFFWKNLEEWLYKQVKVKFHFTVCEILFGLPLIGDPLLEVLNYVIILAKKFINNKRNQNKELIFIEFMYILKENLKILHRIEKIMKN